MLTRVSRAALQAALFIGLAGFSFAQEAERTGEAGQTDSSTRAQGRTDSSSSTQATAGDQQLATCLAIDNRNEVALGQLGQQKAQNEEVKKFAQQMVTDHTKFLQKLGEYGARSDARNSSGSFRTQQSASVESRTGRDDTASGTAPDRGQAGDARSASRARGQQAGDANIDFLSLKQEIAQQCLQSKRSELEGKQGAEFDKCYMGMMLASHMGAIDHLTVFANHASPQFAQVLREGLATTKSHFEHAKSIMKQLEGQGSARQQAN